MLKAFFKKAQPAPARVPDGERWYAIGDIHGCDDAFAAVLDAIDADDRARGPARTHIVLLGDLVDRGPDSRGVVARAMRLQAERPRVELIAGNHEQIMLEAAGGDRRAAGLFHRVGGEETLMSYGVDPDRYAAAGLDEMAAMIAACVPPDHLAFLSAGADHLAAGDYAFVHAGVRPGVPLAEQKGSDLRWIRQPFLSHVAAHDFVVIHGHTIVDAPDQCANRIGIDTGAYQSGTLTAIGLEGADRWFLTNRG